MGSPEINPRYVVATNRLEKATKINIVLEDFTHKQLAGLSILDVGVGTGEIIDFFAARNRTHGVDIEDQRVSKLSSFQAVRTERLPFANDTFDVVLSNHVIEHVASPDLHLREIARVLKPDGIVYLATPNRLFPKETHFKLWLLHYLPDKVYFTMAQWFRRHGERFWLFTPWTLSRLEANCGFQSKNYTPLILADPKRFNAQMMLPVSTGKFLSHALGWIAPTFIHVLTRRDEALSHKG